MPKKQKQLTILLPTYNEANNIAPLLRALSHALADREDYEILIVDDSSDTTPTVIRKLMKTYPAVRLLHRAKEERTGLATAFVEGFRAARSEYIVCMDADLQHPPEMVPELLAAIENSESDIVVATRYREGGGADGLGSRYRKFISHVSRFASWLILPVTRKTTDPGSGFFVVTKELVDSIPFHGLRGFKILIDILTRAPLARVSEIPYVFRKRENEVSKATFKQGIEFLRHILYLRYDEDIYNPKAEAREETASQKIHRGMKLSTWLTDIAALSLIVGIGWFIVGYFTQYTYLLSSYEDWIYHAFRVATLTQDGITSWNHEWGTGMNIWRLYQYGQHHLVMWAVALTGIEIPKMLMYFGVGIYIGLRVALYTILRLVGVTPLFALLGVTTSYTFVQEWIAMQDFSIYVGFAVVPLYLFLWIKTFQNLSLAYVLAAVTGCLWSLHPIMGFSMSLLFGFLVLFSSLKGSWKKLALLALAYLAGATPFLAQYFTAGYFFTNPLFKSPIYLSYSVLPLYGGLSLVYWVLFGLAWLLLLFQSRKISVWVKVLLLFCSFYLILMALGKNYLLPDFLVQFQFSRGISAIALILSVCFAVMSYEVMRTVKARFFLGLVVVLIAVNMVHAVDISSGYYVAPPGNTIDNPVARFFATEATPRGSVYYDNISEASYFTRPGVRFVTSYNEHLQPHPYSTRLNILIKNSTLFTGISASHLQSLEDYATVLGIEYYFFQGKSPFVKGLLAKEGALFGQVAELESANLSDSVAVLRRKDPLHLAYIGERSTIPEELLSGELEQPTLEVATYAPWDQAIGAMAKVLRSGTLTPLELNFEATDRLELRLTQETLKRYQDPVILMQQSYDRGWRIENAPEAKLTPTAVRLMQLELPAGMELSGETLKFKNSWPSWHWPVQAVGVMSVFILSLIFVIRKRLPRLF